MTAAVMCLIAGYFQAQLNAPVTVQATPSAIYQMADESKKECDRLQKEEAKKAPKPSDAKSN